MRGSAETVLEAREITKSFGALRVLDGVSVSLRGGEIVGILGVSGCGKSTLLSIMTGLISPDSGAVFMQGEEITGQKNLVGHMPQKDLLLPWRTALDNAALPLTLSGARKKAARLEAREYFASFSLGGFEDYYPSRLSGGMRQRLALLRTYLGKKRIILFDEPFAALDWITKQKMHLWLLEMVKRLGLSIIFITHDADEAVFLSDRLYILSDKPAKLLSEIAVGLPKGDITVTATKEFLDIKREVLAGILG